MSTKTTTVYLSGPMSGLPDDAILEAPTHVESAYLAVQEMAVTV